MKPGPFLLMLSAVALWSPWALVYELGNAGGRPFAFTAWLMLGAMASSLIVMGFRHPDLLRDPRFYSDVARLCTSPLLLASIVPSLGFVFIALSVTLIGVAVPAVLVELWPVFMVLGMPRLPGLIGSRMLDLAAVVPLSLVAFGGAALVVLSQSGGGQLFSPGLGWPVLLGGTALALVSAIAAGLEFATFRWGARLAGACRRWGSDSPIELGSTLAGFLSNGPAALLFGVIAVVTGERVGWDVFLWAFGGGFFFVGVPNVLFRMANVRSPTMAVNLLAYLTPPAALFWLAVVAGLGVARPELLLWGTGVIVAANVAVGLRRL